jgi:hypothetical protein
VTNRVDCCRERVGGGTLQAYNSDRSAAGAYTFAASQADYTIPLGQAGKCALDSSSTTCLLNVLFKHVPTYTMLLLLQRKCLKFAGKKNALTRTVSFQHDAHYHACIGNCGNLGYACNSAATCIAGACICNLGTTWNGSACTSTSGTSATCGTLGYACNSAASCSNGACVCNPGTAWDGSACTASTTGQSAVTSVATSVTVARHCRVQQPAFARSEHH